MVKAEEESGEAHLLGVNKFGIAGSNIVVQGPGPVVPPTVASARSSLRLLKPPSENDTKVDLEQFEVALISERRKDCKNPSKHVLPRRR